jgi:hypothetical protein
MIIIITTSRNFRMHILLRYSDVGHAVDLCRVVGGGVKSWAGVVIGNGGRIVLGNSWEPNQNGGI